jgi:hypothetical protein
MKSRTKGMKKAQNAKLNAPKAQIYRMMNKLNARADPPQTASPPTNCLRNGYLAADDRPNRVASSCGFQKSLVDFIELLDE